MLPTPPRAGDSRQTARTLAPFGRARRGATRRRRSTRTRVAISIFPPHVRAPITLCIHAKWVLFRCQARAHALASISACVRVCVFFGILGYFLFFHSHTRRHMTHARSHVQYNLHKIGRKNTRRIKFEVCACTRCECGGVNVPYFCIYA